MVPYHTALVTDGIYVSFDGNVSLVSSAIFDAEALDQKITNTTTKPRRKIK